MDGEIECTLNEFANNTKVCSVVDMLEGRDAIQREFESLQNWAYANLTRFNKDIHLGWGNIKCKYRLAHSELRAALHRDFGVLVDEN